MRSPPEEIGEMHIIGMTKAQLTEAKKCVYESMSTNKRAGYSIPSYKKLNRTCQWLAKMQRKLNQRSI